MRPSLAGGGLLVALAACGPAPPGQGAGAPAALFDPGALPAAAPVAGVPLTLSANGWLEPVRRAPAPGGAASGPLSLAVRVSADGPDLPPGWSADRVWVIAGDQTWETPFEQMVRTEGRLEGRARGGPALDPNLPADVVVRLIGPGEAVRFLRVRLAGLPAVP